ncbi:Hypothetical predicted protein [Mytilus galloprovincialis]|uniref:Reverse transcriptase domain-containing protein n=1 Tax=Mytilus galloprovincialis TaxID=29158 RepID=A0A8B6H832_MYTGA|nr:Hypothetical predicted protein [Mytilus galloprovincialis]
MTDLTEILVRFRMYKYAVTADIEKAFLHIELDVDDRDVTRFYWLENPMDTESRLITYRFKVVLFGATCSPFMLSATLMKHFRDNPSTTSTELQRNVYVDNVLTSFTDKQSLLKFYTESRKLLSEAGFNLRSWNSNSTELQNVAGRDKIGDNDDIVKILGMRWDRESDDLKFQQIEFMEKDKMITKDSDSGEIISIESGQAICNSQLPNIFVESLAVNPDVVQSDDDEDEYKDEDIIDWKQAKVMDSQIAPFVRYVREGRKPTTADVGSSLLLRQFQHLILKDGVLYRHDDL